VLEEFAAALLKLVCLNDSAGAAPIMVNQNLRQLAISRYGPIPNAVRKDAAIIVDAFELVTTNLDDSRRLIANCEIG
jgi:hypothetical protein